MADFVIPKDKIGEYFQTLIADSYKMNWQLSFSTDRLKMAIFVSKMSHCLYDLLSRYDGGELHVDIPVMISNHQDLEHIAQKFNIPFEYVPITAENKAEQELKELGKDKRYKYLV